MPNKPFKPFIFLLFVFAIVSLACQVVSSSSDPAPVQPPIQEEPQQPVQVEPAEPPVQEEPQQEEPSTSNGDYVVFTDRNSLYQIEIPGDWIKSDGSGDAYYYDQFKAPDGRAFIENLVYDDGTTFTGNTNGKFALALLHTFYSNTGKEGDIKITNDKIMPDKSERLTWTSRGGGYSGMSFFEVRNKTTFLLFTVEWVNEAESDYFDILNRAIESYDVP
jgi:hypothetical protein